MRNNTISSGFKLNKSFRENKQKHESNIKNIETTESLDNNRGKREKSIKQLWKEYYGL